MLYLYSVSKTEEHKLPSEGPATSQYLTIAINSINSTSFSELPWQWEHQNTL